MKLPFILFLENKKWEDRFLQEASNSGSWKKWLLVWHAFCVSEDLRKHLRGAESFWKDYIKKKLWKKAVKEVIL